MTQEEILKIREQAIKDRQRYIEDPVYRKEYWKKKASEWRPFKTQYDIPDIPVFGEEDQYIYTDIIVPALIRCGAIPKKNLVTGKKYFGDCRNAVEAVWNGEYFVYDRTKFGATHEEKINHFQDDDGYDVFIPIREI